MERIQRKRTKGFKLPANTVCVNRGTKFGNPFKIKLGMTRHMACLAFEDCILNNAMVYGWFNSLDESRKQLERFKWMAENIGLLKGKHLACFCKPEDECHGDILLKLAR